jgi:hypothetical protein
VKIAAEMQLALLGLCALPCAAQAKAPPTLLDPLWGVTDNNGIWSWPIVEEGSGITAPDDGTAPNAPGMHIDGNWSVNYGGNVFSILLANTTFTGRDKNAHHDPHIQLTVPATQQGQTHSAAEIASDAGWSFDGKTWPYGQNGYGYGYYQVTMQTADVGNPANNTGVVNSFFLEGVSCCGGPYYEIDFEFLTNESWLETSQGAVHTTLDGGNNASISQKVNLPFNPSRALHKYGLLITPGGAGGDVVKFYADGQLINTLQESEAVMPQYGVTIYANAWTGNPNWGGLPPASDATASYQHLVYYAGATQPVLDAK